MSKKTTPWSLQRNKDAFAISLYPADGQPRALWIAPHGSQVPEGPSLSTAQWLWSEVISGIATVTLPVQEQFVPQMLNYESVGGVNFKKGCYPGQEVVARSQFRGTLKRRAYVAHAKQLLSAGSEIFAAGDTEQPVGIVVQATEAPDGTCVAIVSLQMSAAGDALQSEGTPMKLLPLPYKLLQDI